MKKILIFSLAYYPYIGGAEIAIKEITDRVGDIEFHMITMRFNAADAPEEKIRNVHVHRVGNGSGFVSKALFAPRAALMARRLQKKETFDALWAMMSYMLFPAVLLQWMGVRLPYVLTLQEGDTESHMFARLRILPFLPLLNSGFRKAEVVQAISNYLGGWAHRRHFAGPLEVIPNGVSVNHFAQEFSPVRVNEIKDKLGKKMGDVFLVTTSRLVNKNAVDDVIRALPLLPHNVYFIILGTGPDEAMLKKLATRLKVAERVQFLGQIGHEELPRYLKACDIFVRPSRSEGMGNSFIEAMAAGLPVIATQEGGIADFLFDEKRNPEQPVTGWAVDKNSPQQIAGVVQDIMNHPEKMRSVIATAKQMVTDKYDWDTIAKAMRGRVFSRALKEATLKP